MSPYQPNWDFDLPLGELQERRTEGILSDIRNGGYHVEVKSDFYLNSSFYLEVQDKRLGHTTWRDTGIRTSRAYLFVLNNPGLNSLHVYRTVDLRAIEAKQLLGRLIEGANRGDCPTRGYVVTPSQLDAAIAYLFRGNDPLYNQEEDIS